MEENKAIGDQGEVLNLSSASRAMNTEPDEEQIEQFDEYEAKASPLKYVAMLLAFVSISLSIYLFYTGHWGWGLILIPLILFFGMLTYSFGKANVTKQIAYESGLIISAIVVETNPIKIIALADMRSSTDQKIIWGCQKMTIKNLPNHKIVVGEKIPCVSLFGIALKGYRRFFEPRPISWGYKNPDLISKTVELITNDSALESDNEWVILEQLNTKMKNSMDKEVVFFDEDLNKVEF
ncbi:DUF3239 domain-containing protein [Olleya sp. HaHaR_3_96]|uniref:DUF3239 domain-containing protein n=1 Tax=Olleya sp. HaHaR_3_96 TaxID=2745560 RepID=UPI001C4F0BF7|nr:DUF3239 domain-containing protein [Olleya sp. HaHaR_3_96]QXP61636.1 DUF3239 domain-containing protein [Olleya sp. HaHaR_3_96]